MFGIQEGQFIIEYCGEVISWKEAKRRAQTYETHGELLSKENFYRDVEGSSKCYTWVQV